MAAAGCCGQQAHRNFCGAHRADLAFGTGLQVCRQLDLASSPQRLIQLVDADGAATVGVKRVEQLVDLSPGRVKAEQRHGLAELLLRDGAVAILVPLAEQVHDAHPILGENVAQLLRH